MAAQSDELYGYGVQENCAPPGNGLPNVCGTFTGVLSAVGQVYSTGGICSGTLVSPNKVLTAAHCFCDSSKNPANMSFWLPQLESGVGGGTTFQVSAYQQHPYWTNDDCDFDGNSMTRDLVVLTLATPVPPNLAEPIPVALADNENTFTNFQQIGFGKTTHFADKDDGIDGAGVRRIGPVVSPDKDIDKCSSIPISFCNDEPIWKGNIVPSVTSVHAPGDSGGPLIARPPGQTVSRVVGVTSGAYPVFLDPTIQGVQTWTPVADSWWFVADALEIPWSTNNLPLAYFPLYATEGAKLNDGAQVVDYMNLNIHPKVLNVIELGVEAQVGPIIADRGVWLRDRSTVFGEVTSRANVLKQNNVTTGAVKEWELVRLPPLGLTPQSVGFQDSINHRHYQPGAAEYLAPGAYGDVILPQEAWVRMTPGTYYFNSLTVQTGGHIDIKSLYCLNIGGCADPDGPTRIFVKGNMTFRGKITAAPSKTLFGVFGSHVMLEGLELFRGTIVAPLADVNLDTLAGMIGTLYAKTATIHQRRTLAGEMFSYTWAP